MALELVPLDVPLLSFSLDVAAESAGLVGDVHTPVCSRGRSLLELAGSTVTPDAAPKGCSTEQLGNNRVSDMFASLHGRLDVVKSTVAASLC